MVEEQGRETLILCGVEKKWCRGRETKQETLFGVLGLVIFSIMQVGFFFFFPFFFFVFVFSHLSLSLSLSLIFLFFYFFEISHFLTATFFFLCFGIIFVVSVLTYKQGGSH